jgi:hypothetical protein
MERILPEALCYNFPWHADVAQLVEQPIRNLQIVPYYQSLTLAEGRQMALLVPVFVRVVVES